MQRFFFSIRDGKSANHVNQPISDANATPRDTQNVCQSAFAEDSVLLRNSKIRIHQGATSHLNWEHGIPRKRCKFRLEAQRRIVCVGTWTEG